MVRRMAIQVDFLTERMGAAIVSNRLVVVVVVVISDEEKYFQNKLTFDWEEFNLVQRKSESKKMWGGS